MICFPAFPSGRLALLKSRVQDFLQVGLGPIAVVVPLTTVYPVVAILVRRFWMDERLSLPQKFAVGLALLGAFLTSL